MFLSMPADRRALGSPVLVVAGGRVDLQKWQVGEIYTSKKLVPCTRVLDSPLCLIELEAPHIERLVAKLQVLGRR
jgi:hypothetical protein